LCRLSTLDPHADALCRVEREREREREGEKSFIDEHKDKKERRVEITGLERSIVGEGVLGVWWDVRFVKQNETSFAAYASIRKYIPGKSGIVKEVRSSWQQR
jgi:hypothetical protein